MCAGSHQREEQADEGVVHLDGWPAERLRQTSSSVSASSIMLHPLAMDSRLQEVYFRQLPGPSVFFMSLQQSTQLDKYAPKGPMGSGNHIRQSAGCCTLVNSKQRLQGGVAVSAFKQYLSEEAIYPLRQIWLRQNAEALHKEEGAQCEEQLPAAGAHMLGVIDGLSDHADWILRQQQRRSDNQCVGQEAHPHPAHSLGHNAEGRPRLLHSMRAEASLLQTLGVFGYCAQAKAAKFCKAQHIEAYRVSALNMLRIALDFTYGKHQ